MRQNRRGFFDRLFLRRSLRGWRGAAAVAEGADPAELRQLRTDARALRRDLDRVVQIADTRLAAPGGQGAAIPAPEMSDWKWRPDPWAGPLASSGIAPVENGAAVGQDVKLFHDCRVPELSLRQVRNTRETDLAPHGLQLDVFDFDGSYLSLVTELPAPAAQSLKARHILRVAAVLDLERPLEVYVRLNLRQGPNTEQIVRELPRDRADCFTEFDLAYSHIEGRKLDRAWVDLIFDNPRMNQIQLRDLTFSRRPRAEL